MVSGVRFLLCLCHPCVSCESLACLLRMFPQSCLCLPSCFVSLSCSHVLLLVFYSMSPLSVMCTMYVLSSLSCLSPSLSPQSACPEVCSLPGPKPVCFSLCVSMFPVLLHRAIMSVHPSCVPMCFHFPRHPHQHILCEYPCVRCQIICNPSLYFHVPMCSRFVII